MENASAAFLEAVRLSMRAIRNALGATTIDPALLTAAERLQYDCFLRREDTTRQILALKEAWHSTKEIVRRARHSRKLVRQTVRVSAVTCFVSGKAPWMFTCPCWMASGCRPVAMAPLPPFHRLAAGTFAGSAELWRRLADQGFLRIPARC